MTSRPELVRCVRFGNGNDNGNGNEFGNGLGLGLGFPPPISARSAQAGPWPIRCKWSIGVGANAIRSKAPH
jgi:hypothetical protein